MKRTLWVWVVLVLAGLVVVGAVTSNTEIAQNITRDGVVNLMWDFSPTTTGALSVRTKYPVVGTLLKAVYVPDSTYPAQGGTTASLTVRPVSEYQGHWYEGTALDTSVMTFTTGGLSVISYWPTKEVVVTTETQIELSTALTDGGLAARGRIWMTLLPAPGN